MESTNIVFRDDEVDKKEFYSAREVILLDKVNASKIVVSDEITADNDGKKVIIGYKTSNEHERSERASATSK